MLCLGQKIRSHKTGIRSLVRQHQDLAGACDGVDAHETVNGFFRQSHIDISGAHDLVHLRDRFRTESHGGDGLSAAGLVDLINAGLPCGHQSGGADLLLPGNRGCT